MQTTQKMYWFLVVFLQCFGTVFGILAWKEHPLDKVIFEGQSVTFRCQLLNAALVNGEHQHWVRLSGDNTKQTFLSDNNLLSSYVDYHVRSRFSITNTPGRGYYQFTIRQATAWDNGQYGCMIYGRSANRRAMSHFGKLTVVPRRLPQGSPVCSFVPAHPKPGGLAEFTCTSLSGAATTNLTWSDGSKSWIPTQVSLSTSRRSISFHKVLGALDNHAVYTCTERWPVPGSETRTCSVVPFDIPINVTVKPRVQRVPIGQYATFFCVAAAVPPPTTYVWYFEGYPVMERPHLFQLRDGGRTLYINQVQGTIGLQYEVRCKAGNGIDSLRTAVAYLYLLAADAPRPVPTTAMPTTPFNPNNTGEFISGGIQQGDQNQMVGSSGDSSVTILLGITCAIGAIILILLALLLIVCLKGSSKRDIPPEPIARSGPSPCKEISTPLHEVPLREVKSSRRSTRSPFSGGARSVRRTVRHSYQPLRKGHGRRKGSTVSLGTGEVHATSSLYENATPLRISFPEDSTVGTTSYANSTCDIEYANSANKPTRPKNSRKAVPFQPISL